LFVKLPTLCTTREAVSLLRKMRAEIGSVGAGSVFGDYDSGLGIILILYT